MPETPAKFLSLMILDRVFKVLSQVVCPFFKRGQQLIAVIFHPWPNFFNWICHDTTMWLWSISITSGWAKNTAKVFYKRPRTTSLKTNQIPYRNLKLQGIKIRDGVVFSWYSRAQCFTINLSDFGYMPKCLWSSVGRASGLLSTGQGFILSLGNHFLRYLHALVLF